MNIKIGDYAKIIKNRAGWGYDFDNLVFGEIGLVTAVYDKYVVLRMSEHIFREDKQVGMSKHDNGDWGWTFDEIIKVNKKDIPKENEYNTERKFNYLEWLKEICIA